MNTTIYDTQKETRLQHQCYRMGNMGDDGLDADGLAPMHSTSRPAGMGSSSTWNNLRSCCRLLAALQYCGGFYGSRAFCTYKRVIGEEEVIGTGFVCGINYVSFWIDQRIPAAKHTQLFCLPIFLSLLVLHDLRVA